MKGLKKLKNSRGEALIEALVSLLIAVTAFGVLAASAATAAKLNAVTAAADTSFRYGGTGQSVRIRLEGQSITAEGGVTLYEENDYLYYTGGAAP